MATYTEPKHIGDVLTIEVKPGWTKDRSIFETGYLCEIGTVLARVAGKLRPINPAGTDDDEKKAIGVLAQNVNTTDGERHVVFIARGAVVATDGLEWPDSITEAQKETAISELSVHGIIAKTEI